MATVDLGRRQFLRGELRARKRPLRPPWALSEAAFTLRCTRCGACREACPQGIIKGGSGAFPRLDFARNGCTFCGECAMACEPGALRRGTQGGVPPWSLVAQVAQSCLATNGIVCRLCGERCEPRAIEFKPQVGGRAVPAIDLRLCTGCGSCAGICPVDAIAMGSRHNE